MWKNSYSKRKNGMEANFQDAFSEYPRKPTRRVLMCEHPFHLYGFFCQAGLVTESCGSTQSTIPDIHSSIKTMNLLNHNENKQSMKADDSLKDMSPSQSQFCTELYYCCWCLKCASALLFCKSCIFLLLQLQDRGLPTSSA